MSHAATSAPRALGIIEVTGVDAAEFLRAQLTNDVARLGPDRHFLAGWCDAKGRALMVTRVAETDGRYLLILPAELIEPIIKRLRMFVLRSKVELADVTATFSLSGLNGKGLPPVNRTETRDGLILLGLPAGDQAPARALVLSARDQSAPEGAIDIESDAWVLQDIDAGLPSVHVDTQGQFVPQMLNLHWLLAIDFDKGCYPGQEVIARLHYRGTLARRLFRLAWQGSAPAPGTDVEDADGARQGTVIQAAGDSASGRLLAVLKTSAADLNLHSGGAPLELLDLPYPTPA